MRVRKHAFTTVGLDASNVGMRCQIERDARIGTFNRSTGVVNPQQTLKSQVRETNCANEVG